MNIMTKEIILTEFQKNIINDLMVQRENILSKRRYFNIDREAILEDIYVSVGLFEIENAITNFVMYLPYTLSLPTPFGENVINSNISISSAIYENNKLIGFNYN